MSDIDLTPPQGVREEARRGLDWRDEYGRGGTDVGIARARDLSNGRNVSEDTIRRMVSFFDRHEAYEAAHDETESDGGPSNARISWALWGGDAGRRWAEAKLKQIEADDGETSASRFSRPQPKPLRKQIAYAGRFVDVSGQEVELTPERFREAVRGSQRLIEAGFKIRGFTSHFTDDSRDVLGTWTSLWAAGANLGGVFQPHSEEARQLALDLDSSMVLEEDVALPNGEVVPLAITRVDIVPQGAVVGASRFEEFRRYVAGGRPSAALSSRRVLLSAAAKEERSDMKPELMKALAAALGMDVAGEIEESQLVEMLDEKLELQDGEDRQEAYARAFGRMFADESECKSEMQTDEAEDKVEMQDEAPEPVKAEMSAMRAEIRSLQDDKANAVLAGIDGNERKRLFSRFSTLREKAGFDLAFETLSDLVGAQQKADPVSTKLSGFAGRGASVATPRKQPPGRTSESDEERAIKTMRAALASRTGAKLESFKDHN